MTRMTGWRRLGIAVVIAASATAAVAPVSAAPGSVLVRGPAAQRTIALTFDDGYSPERCLEIADILDRFGVPATWFPNGMFVQMAPTTWRSIARRFPIGNHTLDHPSLPDLGSREVVRQVRDNERIIEAVTGRPMVPWLRPPYGAYDRRIARLAGGLGYGLALWSVSSADTSPKGSERAMIRNATSGGPGAIVLMHCGPEATPRILPRIITRYACAGFRFATVDRLVRGARGTKARVDCPDSRDRTAEAPVDPSTPAPGETGSPQVPAGASPSPLPSPAAPATSVQGWLELPDGTPLPEGAVVQVEIQDTSRADAPAIVIARTQMLAGGATSPIAFAVSFVPSTVDPTDGITIAARVEGPTGILLAINDTRIAAFLEGDPVTDAVIQLVAVAP